MNRHPRFPRMIHAVVVMLLCVIQAVAAAETAQDTPSTTVTVEAGRQYGGGTRVWIPGLEVELRIPKGWVGIKPVGSGVFLMRSWKRKGYLQVRAIAGDAGYVRHALERPFELEYDVHLLPLGTASNHGEELVWVANDFAVTNTREPFRAYVMARSREPRLGVAIVASGPLAELDAFRDLARRVADTLR